MTQANGVRNSSQDALNESEFERLVDATDKLPPNRGAEAMFILMTGGRLGMRAGEIAHMKESWINWNRKQIEIPHHEPCEKGEDGGPCGYCKKAVRQSVGYNPERDFDELLSKYWQPKTSNSVRAAPFSHSDRIEVTLQEFFADRDEYGHSRVSINRRVTEVAEAAGLDPEGIYPHCLRSTAASALAYEGVPAVALQSLFGWANLSVANKYLRLAGGATANALQEAHDD